MSDYASIVPFTKPVLTKEHYDRMTPEQKAKAGESYFLSLYVDQIYKTKNAYDDGEVDNEEDAPFMDTSSQYEMVQGQFNQVLADDLARRGILGFGRLVQKGKSAEEN